MSVSAAGRRDHRHVVAYHEAGHAVVALAQGLTVLEASIIPDRQNHGSVSKKRAPSSVTL
jgi:ATP-dependent Zn protease